MKACPGVDMLERTDGPDSRIVRIVALDPRNARLREHHLHKRWACSLWSRPERK